MTLKSLLASSCLHTIIGLAALTSVTLGTAHAAETQAVALSAQLNALIQAGKAAEAFELGLKRFDDHAGEPEFDFAFGMAAMESGHYDHAALAFTRVIRAQPWNDRARLERARAEHAAGNYPAARQGFEKVLANNPPARVRQHIETFLNDIELREQAQGTQLVPYVGLRLGHDSNPASATAEDIHLPSFPGTAFTVDRPEDGFVEALAGVDYYRPFSKTQAFFAGAGITERRYWEEDDYSLRVFDARLGGVFVTPLGRIRLPVQYQHLQLGDDAYRNVLSAGFEGSRALGTRTEGAVFAQVGSVRYAEAAVSDLDVNTLTLGLAATHQLSDNGLQMSGAVFFGKDIADSSAAEFNGRNYGGFRLGLNWPVARKHLLGAQLSYQHARHDEDHPAFADRRVDDLGQASLSWLWRPEKRWEVKASVEYYSNNSSLSLYEYDRTVAQVGLRYIWE